MITVPTIGQDPWGSDANAALSQIGDLATNVTDAAYGATGNGVSNDTVAVQAAIDAVEAVGGGVVYFPRGTYLVSSLTVPADVRLTGAGREATTITKSANGVLISLSGPSTDATGATHVKYAGIQDMTLNGNSLTGNLLQLYYANNLLFQNVHLTSNNDVMVDTAEFWDSRFINCTFETVTGAANSTTPMINLRNSAAAAGFGFSADTVNQIVFLGCRWENFTNGALRISAGTSNTNNPNGIYVTDCKMETSNLRGGSHLLASADCVAIYVNGLYCYAGDFFSGYATAQNIITWSAQDSSLENVLLANGAVATVNSGIDLFSGANSVAILRNVIGNYTTAPTGAHVFYEASSTADFNITNSTGSAGAQSAGTVPIRYEGHSPIKQVAGVPADASFTRTPLNGTLALNTTAGELYMRIGGSWVTVDSTPASFTAGGNLIVNAIGSGLRVAEGSNAKMGATALVGGAATVSTTAVTAASRIFLTSQVDGGTPGFVRVDTRSAGVSFHIQSSSGTDTSTIAWMLVEPA
jgi:hypothetical protein